VGLRASVKPHRPLQLLLVCKVGEN